MALFRPSVDLERLLERLLRLGADAAIIGRRALLLTLYDR